METKKSFYVVVLIMSVVIIIQSIIIAYPFKTHPVTTPESAIIIAKAELIRRYGETVVTDVEFIASKIGYYPNNWFVTEVPLWLGDGPFVLVRMSDGKVKMRWEQ